MAMRKPGEQNGHGLADSGARAKSRTGGMFEPKAQLARYDLIPFECISRAQVSNAQPLAVARFSAYRYLAGDRSQDYAGVVLGSALLACGSWEEGLRRLAEHYGRGALKYEPRNWEKGIETHVRVNSLFNHFDKAMRDQKDEDHVSAIGWNISALMYYEKRLRDGRLPIALDTYGLVRS